MPPDTAPAQSPTPNSPAPNLASVVNAIATDLDPDRLGTGPLASLRRLDLGGALAAPALLRLGGHRSVSSLVRSHLRDEALRRVFSLQPLLVGGHPFRTSAIYALIPHLEQRWGVMFQHGALRCLLTRSVRLQAAAASSIAKGDAMFGESTRYRASGHVHRRDQPPTGYNIGAPG